MYPSATWSQRLHRSVRQLAAPLWRQAASATLALSAALLSSPRRPPKLPHLWPPKLLHPGHGDLMH